MASKWVQDVGGKEPVRKAARQALKGRLEQVWQYFPLADTRPRSETENVHQLRVATRRAVAAMNTFESLLPEDEGKWMDKQLKRVRRAAGDARDLDVMAERLSHLAHENPRGPYGEFLTRLKERRNLAQKPIEEIYQKLREKDFPARASALFKHLNPHDAKETESKTTYAEAARAALGPLTAEFFASEQGDFEDYDAVHAFRIAGKELRYALEIFSGALDRSIRKEVYPAIEKLQEWLGEFNDHATAQRQLGEWLGDFDDPALAQAVQQMIEQEKVNMEQVRQEFCNWWTAERSNELKAGLEKALS